MARGEQRLISGGGFCREEPEVEVVAVTASA